MRPEAAVLGQHRRQAARPAAGSARVVQHAAAVDVVEGPRPSAAGPQGAGDGSGCWRGRAPRRGPRRSRAPPPRDPGRPPRPASPPAGASASCWASMIAASPVPPPATRARNGSGEVAPAGEEVVVHLGQVAGRAGDQALGLLAPGRAPDRDRPRTAPRPGPWRSAPASGQHHLAGRLAGQRAGPGPRPASARSRRCETSGFRRPRMPAGRAGRTAPAAVRRLLAVGAPVEAEDREVLDQQEVGRDLRHLAGGEADDQQAPAPGDGSAARPRRPRRRPDRRPRRRRGRRSAP